MMRELAQVPLHFFQFLQSESYLEAWQLLSSHSQEILVKGLSTSLSRPESEIWAEFRGNERLARFYWTEMKKAIRLTDWLNQSYQALGETGKQALVKANPSGVLLVVSKEQQEWKMGYFETFLSGNQK